MDVAAIAAELTNPQQRGVVCVRQFIDNALRQRALDELTSLRPLFRKGLREYKNAVQDLFYLEFSPGIYHNVDQVITKYRGLRDALAQHAQYSQLGMLQAVALRYETGSEGITLHRDESFWVNCIGIIVLSGYAPFYTAEDRRGKNQVDVEPVPGDLILMRAPRGEHDPLHRPIHGVGNVREERLTLLLREVI